MELKYYLRGLGLGIVVTAIIMGIVSSRSSAMTDDEIIARAKQLGMTENRVLTETTAEDADAHNEPDDEGQEPLEENNLKEDGTPASPENAPEQNAPDENTPSDTASVSDADESENIPSSDDAVPVSVPDDAETGQETQTEPEDEAAQNDAESPSGQADAAEQSQEEASGAPAVITVGSGDGSYTVSKKLEDAGVVSSASTFDTFLCENGYDKKIRAGNYTIPSGASDEQIAKMITGQSAE